LGPVRFARVGEDWIGYRTLGDRSEHAILSLPTLAGNVDMMLVLSTERMFFERLAEFATVVFFDRRGTGVSDGVPNAIAPTLEDWADDALAVLDSLGLGRVSILAHGMGVPPALSFAAGYPSRVDSLVLVQGYARMTSCDGYEIGVPSSARIIDRLVDAVAQSWGEGSAFFVVHPEMRGDSEYADSSRASNAPLSVGRLRPVRTEHGWPSTFVTSSLPCRLRR